MSAHKRAMPDAASLRVPENSLWAKLPMLGFGIGIAGLAVAFGMGMTSDEGKTQLFHSYLVSYLYWLSIALGGLFFVTIQFAARAGNGVTVRRMAENIAMTLPFFALLFIPIVLAMSMTIAGPHGDAYILYDHWLHPHDEIVQGKSGYLNRGFFMIRLAVYFIVWCGLAVFFYRNSTAQDQTGDISHTAKMQAVSYPAIALFAITMTFASIDWIMSLDPHWYSTMFGVYYFAGSTVSMFAFMSFVCLRGVKSGIFQGTVDQEHIHDLGKWTFAFTVFWSYIAFSQYFLIWYANMPEETLWFAERLHGSWLRVAQVLIVGHFAVPFLFLLPRTVKRNSIGLTLGAIWLLALHWVDLHWVIMPQIHPEGFALTTADVATFVGVGGIFIGAFGMFLKKQSVIPLKDPRLHESLAFENF